MITVDGKAQVLTNLPAGRKVQKDYQQAVIYDYWPLGSEQDREVLHELRAQADCLIHGKNLAKEFGQITLNSLNKPEFKKMRTDLGKNPKLPYYIVTDHAENLPNLTGVKIVGSDLQKLSEDLYEQGFENILVEGGPTLLGSFLKENLMDEIFLTIAPKIVGNLPGQTLTMVEGYLFPADQVKKLELISVQNINSELFLRYSVIN
ncbi:MAG: RibD family protein [Candidatus Daviesbacteria bacterium]|nr:RibD family protein [Candidatus Daviesbacteria bacterium]